MLCCLLAHTHQYACRVCLHAWCRCVQVVEASPSSDGKGHGVLAVYVLCRRAPTGRGGAVLPACLLVAGW